MKRMLDKKIVSLEASPFYLLDEDDRSRCFVESGKDLDFERVVCTVDPGHTRPGKRLNELNVIVPCEPVPDVMYTHFHDYLTTDRIRDQFIKEGITGLEFVSTKAVTKGTRQSLKLWEAVIVGWGGQAAPESGIRLEEECPACHDRYYSPIIDPEMLVQLDQWDGSDVFMIWPFAKYMFVTEKVADLLIRDSITGVTLRKSLPSDLLAADGFGPGGLALWMPEPRAHAIGDRLGICSYR